MDNLCKRRCIYKWGAGYCDYIGQTGHKRPCPIQGCTVCVTSAQARKKKSISFASRPKPDYEMHQQRTAMWLQGMTDKEMADELGIKRATVTKWRKRMGYPANGRAEM